LQERNHQEEYRKNLNLGTVYRMEGRRSLVVLVNSISGTYDACMEKSSAAYVNLALSAGYELPR
jgi:hypothetical protein